MLQQPQRGRGAEKLDALCQSQHPPAAPPPPSGAGTLLTPSVPGDEDEQGEPSPVASLAMVFELVSQIQFIPLIQFVSLYFQSHPATISFLNLFLHCS